MTGGVSRQPGLAGAKAARATVWRVRPVGKAGCGMIPTMTTHEEFERAKAEITAKIQEVIRDLAALNISAVDRAGIDIDLHSAIGRLHLALPVLI